MRKHFILSCVFVAIGFLSALGQADQAVDNERAVREKNNAAFNSRIDRLRNVGKDNIIRDRYKNTKVYINKIKPLYRDLDAKEESLLAPDPIDVEKFGRLTGKDGWGLTKLMFGQDCDQGSEVVKSSPHCIKYKMPGAGSSFSFRTKSYRVKRLADLSFSRDGFETIGVLKHGILVNIGNNSIDSLTLKHDKLKTIVGFQPVTDFDLAVNLVSQLRDGINGGNFVYGSVLPVQPEATYVLRSIAYRGSNAHTVEEITYDELEFDKRRDVVIAFRVVRVVPNESLTIIWRLLSDKKSPKLKSKR